VFARVPVGARMFQNKQSKYMHVSTLALHTTVFAVNPSHAVLLRRSSVELHSSLAEVHFNILIST
jgi:hypothetical protein